MPLATHASLVLARFADIRQTGPVYPPTSPDTLFLKAGADVRAANSNARDQRGFNFVVYGLHTSQEAARAMQWTIGFPSRLGLRRRWRFGRGCFPLFDTSARPIS